MSVYLKFILIFKELCSLCHLPYFIKIKFNKMILKSSASLVVGLLLSLTLSGQSTFTEVYNIFQAKCATCHSNANPQSGLDLEGAGATDQNRPWIARLSPGRISSSWRYE